MAPFGGLAVLLHGAEPWNNKYLEIKKSNLPFKRIKWIFFLA
jgi:hypothetical protein